MLRHGPTDTIFGPLSDWLAQMIYEGRPLWHLPKFHITSLSLAPNANHIASVGFTICTLHRTLSPLTLNHSEEKLAILRKKKKN